MRDPNQKALEAVPGEAEGGSDMACSSHSGKLRATGARDAAAASSAEVLTPFQRESCAATMPPPEPGANMRRRDFIIVFGGAVTWPLTTRAQPPTMAVIGFIDSRASDGMASRMDAFRRGLKDAGFSEGENAMIEYRWAENRVDRLPHLAAELVHQRVAVIFATGGPPAAFAAKAATSTIPVVFLVGEDPAKLGLVSSLARPNANLTGVNLFANELEAKRLELLHQFVPRAARIAVLVNPADIKNSENTLEKVGAAARVRGLQIEILGAKTASEIDDAFASMRQKPVDALFVGASAFLNSRRVQLAQLAAAHRIPAAYAFRDAAETGGLMSYGPSIVDAYRQCGMYVGRILRGAKPADLPVMQAQKFELVINARTAKLLGLDVPQTLLAIADEVID
jgi:putative ABC transport system substrate-binding protein